MDQKHCGICDNSYPRSEFKYGKSSCYSCQKQMACEWKAKNKEYTQEYTRRWREQHKEDIKQYNANYALQHKEAIQRRSTRYHNERAKVDFNFKMAKTLRTSLRYLVKNGNMAKGRSALELLGCSLPFLKEWFAYNFSEDMSFDNHGKVWHIDHTVPVSKFNLSDEREAQLCFHWSNLKPMYAADNMSKKNHLTSMRRSWHPSWKMYHNYLKMSIQLSI